MVLNWHGLIVTQERIVQKLHGAAVDAPATVAGIIESLSGWVPDSRGRYSIVRAAPLPADPAEILEDLSNKWPLIVGFTPSGGTGHAYVWSAVYFSLGTDGRPVYDKLLVRDPWPGSPSLQELEWSRLVQSCTFATRVYVDRM